MKIEALETWELLQKKMTWQQLGDFEGKRILDFGCGNGLMSAYYADKNMVTAIDPDARVLQENPYDQVEQICGSLEVLKAFEDASFDVIFCHNVLEYASQRQEIMQEFERLLKRDGIISVLKHHLPGRVMQMAVLLNDFEKANALLDGKEGSARKYGTISYYQDSDLTCWAKGLQIAKVLGMRTFWDLQQNQTIQKDEKWQKEMLELEKRVSEREEFKAIAFFHHIILVKKQENANEKE